MNASVVLALRTGLLTCALSLAGIPAAGAATFDFTSPAGDVGSPTHTYMSGGLSLDAAAGTLTGTTFSPGSFDLWGKSLGGDESGLGLANDPTGDHEIHSDSVIRISSPVGTSALTFQMGSVQIASGDAWSVLGSVNGTNFTPILTDQTDESSHSLSGFDFYLFAEAAGTPGNVLLSTIIANAVPLPPALFLFGTVLAGLGFLSRRRKEGASLQAL